MDKNAKWEPKITNCYPITRTPSLVKPLEEPVVFQKWKKPGKNAWVSKGGFGLMEPTFLWLKINPSWNQAKWEKLSLKNYPFWVFPPWVWEILLPDPRKDPPTLKSPNFRALFRGRRLPNPQFQKGLRMGTSP